MLCYEIVSWISLGVINTILLFPALYLTYLISNCDSYFINEYILATIILWCSYALSMNMWLIINCELDREYYN